MNEEIGRSGQKRYGGVFYEEFLTELQGIRGVRTYLEMSENDDVIGAILFAIKMLIRQVKWGVQTVSNDKPDLKAAEFVESCLHDMQSTWTDTVSEILSFLTYGWSVHEIVYKRRMGAKKDPRLDSKFSDGLIGWQKLPIRSQESLYEWDFDEHDNLRAFVQMPAPSFRIIRIPVDKILLFRTESRKDNPEGRSILRNAYRAWFYKTRIQEIEGIGIERDLAGFPVLTSPEGVDLWNDLNLYNKATKFVSNIRRDAMEGMALPFGWKLELLTTGGKRQFDTSEIIKRYDTRIAMTVLADFLFLGHGNTGSWALSSDKTRLFSMAIGAYLDIIIETFNRKAIPQLMELNKKFFAGIGGYPKLVHGDIEVAEYDKIAPFLRDLIGVGVLTPDESLEDFIRATYSLPPRIDDKE
ncbi:MAG: hypothetical protein II968_03775 [Selenomonadaceae bacterium]|nr:hypothetical protein [Selenomonadaceae bacterium]